jgi:hypothetical protein
MENQTPLLLPLLPLLLQVMQQRLLRELALPTLLQQLPTHSAHQTLLLLLPAPLLLLLVLWVPVAAWYPHAGLRPLQLQPPPLLLLPSHLRYLLHVCCQVSACLGA